MQDIYNQTKRLISLQESTEKPIIIKGDIPHHKLMMFVGRSTVYFSNRLSTTKGYLQEYLDFLEKNNFALTLEKSSFSDEVITFKARLKQQPSPEHSKERILEQ